MQIRTDPNVLYHHGVKGMKWGHRQIKNVGSIARSTSNALNEGSKIANTVSGSKHRSKKVKNDLNSMSDQELRARLNRLNMEQQYTNLNPSQVTRGASYVKSVLEVAGSVAAIAGSAAAIAGTIYQIKNGK